MRSLADAQLTPTTRCCSREQFEEAFAGHFPQGRGVVILLRQPPTLSYASVVTLQQLLAPTYSPSSWVKHLSALHFHLHMSEQEQDFIGDGHRSLRY